MTPTAGLDPLLYRVLAEAGLSYEVVDDTANLISRIQQAPGALLVEQTGLTPQVTEALTASFRDQPGWSDLPVILVLAPQSGSWPASLDAIGSVFLLERPLRRQELVSTVRTAIRMRRRQFEVRDQLAQREQTQQALTQRVEQLEVNNDTTRQQVEQAYRRLFDNKINGMAHGRLVEDKSGQPVDFVFLEVNDTFERMTGLGREMVTGRRFTQAIQNLSDLCFNPVAACAQVARTGDEAQFEFRHEQTNRWFSVYLYSPRPGEFIGIFTDISQRKHAEQRLHELNETLERRVQERTAEAEHRATQLRRLAAELTQAEERERRRLARVLHDHLQQLLVGMQLSLASLQRQLPTEDLRQSAQQLNDLLNQSIATSRSLTAELSPPVLYEAGLAQALDWLAGWMRDKHGLIVDVQADVSVNPHEKIRVLLFQVVRELLFNVVKHANTYQASVRMSQVGQQVQILVEDAGVGFDPQHARQRHRTTSGLGLFSIRERLEWLGGQMTVDSAPSHGTRVQILAPLQLAADEKLDLLQEQPLAEVLQQAKAGPAEGQAEPPGNRIRILLADDHAVMRDGLAQLLQTQSDIEVVGQAADGQEAVDLTVQLRPDVVLMDVTMPRLGGVDATRRIKEQFAHAHVIGLSMHIEEDMAAAMREAGASDYLTKSADPEDLIATIHSCCQ